MDDDNNRDATEHLGTTEPSAGAYVPLSAALTRIAFNHALKPHELRRSVEGERPPVVDSPEELLRKFFSGDDDPPQEVPGTGYFVDRNLGLERLEVAWSQLRDEVDRGNLKVRGRYTQKYSRAEARLADVEALDGARLATFSQFDVWIGVQKGPR